MDQIELTQQTAYEVATLASRVSPELCISDPKKAIKVASRLLQVAREGINEAEELEKWRRSEEHQERLGAVEWVEALKEITGQTRRDRAEERFWAFVRDDDPDSEEMLKSYRNDRFPVSEMRAYRVHFKEWSKKPKRKARGQGRRIREDDGRLRTELIGLEPRKPRKAI